MARLASTAELTRRVIRSAGLTPSGIGALFLVGGASRVPIVSTMLHRATGIAPTVIEQPELVVAEGALADGPVAPAGPLPGPAPTGPVTGSGPMGPVSGVPMSGVPMSGVPMSGGPVSTGAVSGAVTGSGRFGPAGGTGPFGPVTGPAPMPAPAGPMTPRPPRPRRGGRIALLVSGVVVLVLAVCGGAVYGAVKYYNDTRPKNGGDTSGPLVSGGRTPSPSAEAGLVTSTTVLPDPCGLDAARPGAVASVQPEPTTNDIYRSCRWEKLESRRAVYLGVKISIAKDSKAAGQELADGRTRLPTDKYHGAVTPLANVGEEAFTTPYSNLIGEGPNAQNVTNYNLGGVYLQARVRNVVLTIEWAGADYPGGQGKNLRGTNFPLDRSRTEAEAMARQLLGKIT